MVIRAAAALALLAGCELFVTIPSGKLAGDAGGTCSQASQCAAPTPLCDTLAGTCVECLADPDCPSARPHCDQGACRACADDTECASAVCKPDGACADASAVLYAASDGTGMTCTAAAPCTLDTAVTLLTPTAAIIKLAPGMYERTGGLAVPMPALVTGAGALLHDASGGVLGAALLSTAGPALTLYRLALALDAGSGIGVQCSTAGALTLARVTVSGGLVGGDAVGCTTIIDRCAITNAGVSGFHAMGGTATITSSYFTHDGSTASMSEGALVLDGTTAATVMFTTIADNTATTGFAGISCTNAATAEIADDIIYGNAIDPGCIVAHSIVDPSYTGGVANVSIDPMFLAPATDYHLAPGSPARGLADPAVASGVDYDGDPRPMPAATAPDPGADEIP